MKRASLLLLCSFGVLLIVGVGGVSLGFVPMLGRQDSARPPCEQLPDKKSVADAVASHGDLVARIQEAGPGVEVDVATPCGDQPNRAIVRVTYTTGTERDGVDAVLRRAEGFGAPVELVSD